MEIFSGLNTDSNAEQIPEADRKYAPNVSVIERDNQMLAEFMGLTYQTYPTLKHLNDYQYHTSWDWLMPVIEKICKLKIGDGKTYVDYAYPRTFGTRSEEEPHELMVRLNGFFIHRNESLIKGTYSAVVEFIKYYSEIDKSEFPRHDQRFTD